MLKREEAIEKLKDAIFELSISDEGSDEVKKKLFEVLDFLES